MNWRLAIEEEVAVLKRIVALLFALAGLAESAAGRSPAVRVFVLWLLRHAEAVARDFAALEPDLEAPLPIVSADASAAAALQLAATLRVLAMQINLQATLASAVFRATFGETSHLPGAPMPAMHRILDALSGLAIFVQAAPHFANAPDTS